jgi:cold shock CspA family protein
MRAVAEGDYVVEAENCVHRVTSAEPAIFFHVSGFGEIFVFPGEVRKGKRVVFEIENGERGLGAKNLALVEAV